MIRLKQKYFDSKTTGSQKFKGKKKKIKHPTPPLLSSTDSFEEPKRITLDRRVGFDGSTELN
jgi:hypothetical protein